MNTIDDILAAALALPSEDRAKLIPLLWDRISPEDWPMPSAAWIAESNRRSDLIDNGEMKADDWKDVRARARRNAGLS
ncbi:MAG: addiction module protein [Pirellulaceae bacterium]